MEKRIKLADDNYFILNDLCSQNSISNSYILKFNFFELYKQPQMKNDQKQSYRSRYDLQLCS